MWNAWWCLTWNHGLELLISKTSFFASSFTAFIKSWFKYQKHLWDYLMIFHSTNSKNDSMIGFSTFRQLETTLFLWFISSHTPETNFQVTSQHWQNPGSSIKNTYWLLFEDFLLNKKQNDLIIGFCTSKQLEITFFW